MNTSCKAVFYILCFWLLLFFVFVCLFVCFVLVVVPYHCLVVLHSRNDCIFVNNYIFFPVLFFVFRSFLFAFLCSCTFTLFSFRLNYVIVRPAIIYGVADRRGLSMFHLPDKKSYCFYTTIEFVLSLTTLVVGAQYTK